MADPTDDDIDYIVEFMRDSTRVASRRQQSGNASGGVSTAGRGSCVDVDEASLRAGLESSLRAESAEPSLLELCQPSSSGSRSDFYNAALTASYMLAQYELTRELADDQAIDAPNGPHVHPNPTARRPETQIIPVRRPSTRSAGDPQISPVRRLYTRTAGDPHTSGLSLPSPVTQPHPALPPAVNNQNRHPARAYGQVPTGLAGLGRTNEQVFQPANALAQQAITAPYMHQASLSRPLPQYKAHQRVYTPPVQHPELKPAYQDDYLGQSRDDNRVTAARSTSVKSDQGALAAAPPSLHRPVDHGVPTADVVDRRWDALRGLGHNHAFGDSHEEVHDKTALRQLLAKSERFMSMKGCNMRETPFFYRDKTLRYFQDIMLHNNGLMEVYVKDFHGDPKSPINGRLNGLFFSVNIDLSTGVLPTSSIYGQHRLLVPPTRILNLCQNFYFTDFYCVNRPHYITLVMTRPGSSADGFCRNHLVLLDWNSNPFFQVRHTPGGEMRFFVRHGIWVEIMVTENIDLEAEVSAGAAWTPVTMRGNRTGGRRGLVKNRNCSTCNL